MEKVTGTLGGFHETVISPETKDVIISTWSMLMSYYTGSLDIVLGYVGPIGHLRSVSCPGNPVPLRINLDNVDTIQALLRYTKSQADQTTEFGLFDLHRIQRVSNEAEHACNFQTVLKFPYSNEFDRSTSPQSYPLTLGFYTENKECKLVADYDSQIIDRNRIERLIIQMKHLLRLVSTSPTHVNWRQVSAVPQTDLHTIWRRNMNVPQTEDANFCTLFSRTLSEIPNNVAVSSWDGDFNYTQLDTLSTNLANGLRRKGILPGTVVPLYFEKSKWTTLAILGVLKAGCTVLLQSSSIPHRRRRQILSRVDARLLVVSSMTVRSEADEIPTFTVTDLLESEAMDASHQWLTNDPAQPATILFTSGSTGEPKGIIWSHSTLAANAIGFGRATRLGQHTRTFQFASYDFDVSIVETCATLIFGGCICTPSESQRLDQLSDTMAKFQSNLLCITPTAAASLHPHKVPSLTTIVFAGESLKKSDIERFPGTNVINWYGPAEASFAASCSANNHVPWQDGKIGSPLMSVSWVVDRLNNQTLVPLGGIGELVIEGPIIALEYFKNPELTTASFIHDPAWLLRGVPDAGIPGRHGRLFKTGDLVRQQEDGSLIYIGRKDAQVKIRGQRAELDEIEHHLHTMLPKDSDIKLVPEVVTPTFSNVPLLVVFLSSHDSAERSREIISELQTLARDRLAQLLPSHMIPSAYVAIEEIPITSTGKVNRRRLQALGSALTVIDIHQERQEETRVLTPAERQMKKLWASILHTDEENIHVNDSFLLIGGDSILAMKLVGKAREKGFSLTVTDVLRKPRLSEMAMALGKAETLPIVTNLPSDIGPSRSRIPTNDEISELLQLPPANIVEVVPVTDFQTLCLEGNIQSPRKWWANLLIQYNSSNLLPEQVATRCLQLWEAFDILRSNFVKTNGRYWQVLTRKINPSVEVVQVSGQVKSTINRFAEEEESHGYQLGKAATSFTIVHNERGQIGLRVGLSHAQYDGICLPQMVQFLGDINGVQAFVKPMSFNGFVRHASMVRNAGVAYWRNLLKGSYPTQLPRLVKSSKYDNPSVNGHTTGTHAMPDNCIREVVCLKAFSQIPRSEGNFSAATVFSTACALALSKATGSSDITFGRVVSGRSTLPPNLQNVFGPCINIVPLRVQLDQNATQQQVLDSVHNQYVNGLLYETVGFKDIINECTAWKDDYFGCTVQYQNIASPTGTTTSDHYSANFWRSGRIGIGGPWVEIFAIPVENELEITVLSKVHDRDMLQRTLDEIVQFIKELR